MQQKWRTVRPWLPPSSTSSASAEEGSSTLRLEVLDVTSTAVALSVLTPPSSSPSPSRPQISIQLDRRPWPHVAHAGSESGVETTVIVYGLEPGVEYEISLQVVRAEEERESTVVEIETPAAVEPPTAAPATEPTPPTPDAEAPALPDGPPPPYSPALPPAPDEAQLRALLKQLRTSSKRTETVLNSSISALKKSVEKGQKEDQRARSRIVAIEDAIRKARDGEAELRGVERQRCEDRVRELEQQEIEVADELARRKAGGQVTPAKIAPPTPPQEDEQEEEGHELGLADLAKELDALNRRIEDAESDRRAKAAATLRLLELELGQIENDLNQLDRDEAHRYNIAARLSSDSLDYLPAPPSSSFLSKWNRTPRPPTSAPSDPRSFGRFFRRTPSSPIPAPLPEAHTSPDGQFHAQSFAQAQQAIWAAPLSGFASTLRRRSGSLNSTARAFGTDEPFSRVSSLPSVNGDVEEGKKEGGGWGRAWSQVVVRSGRNGSQASVVTPDELAEVV